MRRINGIEEDEDNGGGIGLMHTKEIRSIRYGQNLNSVEKMKSPRSKVTVWIPEKVERDFHKREENKMKPNLLIVDDEVVTTEVFQRTNPQKKIPIRQIFVAYNAAMARECLEHQKIDIVPVLRCQTSVDLNYWNGFAKGIRQIEFLFLTSYEKFEYAFRAAKNGAANYLLKPLDMPTINHALYVVTEKICKKRQMSLAEEYWSHGKRGK